MRGSVRGSVVRVESGYPVAGVLVSASPVASPPGSPGATISARSDPSGAFGFDYLIEGEWLFTMEGSPGEILTQTTARVFDDALSDVTLAVPGEWRPSASDRPHGDSARDLEPARPRTPLHGAVRGRVVRHASGQPVAGATLSVVSGEGREPDMLPVSDADGFFALDGLPEGEWLLRAIGPGHETGTATVHVFDNSLSDVTIEVAGPGRTPRRSGSSNKSERPMHGNLRGRVVRSDTGAPIPDATITIVTGAGPAPDIAPLSNASGAFSLDGLPAGQWVLRATAPQGGAGEATVSVKAGAVSNVVIQVSPLR
jgi:uncharacterized GH25 family protein